MEIGEFVKARLDEDEAAAKLAAREGGTWKQDDPDRHPGAISSLGGPVVYDEGSPDEHQAAHIARHDPARVLREVTAKRAILAMHKVNAEPEIWGDRPDAPEMRGKPTGYTNYWCNWCDHDRDYGHIGGREEGCPTLRHLAAIWSDHADYDPSWSPHER